MWQNKHETYIGSCYFAGLYGDFSGPTVQTPMDKNMAHEVEHTPNGSRFRV